MKTSIDKTKQAAMADAFRARHKAKPILFLPNVWDAMSARIFAASGFEALATTSAGVAWALSFPDGEVAPWEELVAATARIARAANVPVTADIEGGYAATPQEMQAHISEIIGAGIVGVNVEDGMHGPLRTKEDAVARIKAARDAAGRSGIPIVINARCDIYLAGKGTEDERFAATVERCNAYLEAGADCAYPIGVRDAPTIGRLAKGIKGPINVMGRPDTPDLAALEALGVARATVAGQLTVKAVEAVSGLAQDMRKGNFAALTAELQRPELQKLFAP